MKKEMNLGEWLEKWYNVYKLPNLSKSGSENIERVIRLHISDELKRVKLSKLRAFQIDEALSKVKSSRMRKYAFSVLHSSLRKAYCLDLIKSDLMSKVESVKHKQAPSVPLSVEEQEQFMQAIQDLPQRELFLFYLYTGVRRNEAVSLRWSDVDFLGSTVRIRGTKSATSCRTLHLLPEVMDLLESQQRKCLSAELVFPYSGNYVDHLFHSLCPAHKLHDLRHTFITRCAESGINVNVTQKLAGHSDVKLTLKVYTHVSDDFGTAEYEKFSVFGKKKPSTDR